MSATIRFQLSNKERDYLRQYKKTQSHSLREFNRASILLFLDKGMGIGEIADLLEVERTTIWRIRKRYQTHGLETALREQDRPGQPAKYTASHEAELVALVCGPLPRGRRRWTIRLLVGELNNRKGFETITFGSVRQMLKKTNLSLC